MPEGASQDSAMAEISEATTSSDPLNTKSEEENFDPKTMRKTKPGLKRLFLTLTVFISFLIALPFLLKSIEIYRAPLPFEDIDLLSMEMEKNHLVFPCQFQAVFVNFDEITAVNELGLLIDSHMQKLTSENSPPCGTCGNNVTVAVTIDSNSNCIHRESGNGNGKWQCGMLNGFDKVNDHDEDFDEYLESVLDSTSRKVYTVVVINRKQEDVRIVVGKYRHAWIVGNDSVEKAIEKMAEIFIKVFVNGGKEEGSIRGEFMPVGADGKVVLSFSLLNSDPHDWVYDWDFKELDEILLAPVVDALRPVADISVESQVLYHTPKSSYSYWDDTQGSYIFSTKDLPFFVNSNEWHLDTSTAAGGRSKVMHFVLYVPSAKECPLKLQLPNGEISMTNGFISPMWGGIIVWNPPACVENFQMQHLSKHKISQDCFIVWEEFGCQEDMTFCGIFDGHGPWGHFVSKKVRESIVSSLLCIWQESLAEASADPDLDKKAQRFNIWKESFLKACATVDQELEHHPKIDTFYSGTTALTIVRQGEVLFIANVGDSRAVLATTCDDGNLVPVQLTVDFKPNLPQETERILQCNGRVFCLDDESGVHRLWLPDESSPGLAMSRAFGDYCVKDFGLISVPDVTQRHITSKDQFVVLATDGVWDVISNEEAVEIVTETPDRAKAAKHLVQCAVRAWKRKRRGIAVDDISAIVLFFHSKHFCQHIYPVTTPK